jgi:hypothetical protein
MSPSDILNHINVRRRIASCEAELIARSHELLARSEALLQQRMPTTFLGDRRDPHFKGPGEGVESVRDHFPRSRRETRCRSRGQATARTSDNSTQQRRHLA